MAERSRPPDRLFRPGGRLGGAGLGPAAWSALREFRSPCVIFTHFMVINALVSVANQTQPVVAFEPDYCSVTRLQLSESGVSVRALGRARASLVL